MADYNVNMKQWNGTSFDNVFPLAYDAKQLGGQSLAEVKQWVQDNNLLLYTGQYTGTGTYGESNPVSIQFPFEPKLFIFPISAADDYPASSPLDTRFLTTSYKQVGRVHEVYNRDSAVYGAPLMARFSDSSRKKLQIYSTRKSAANQSNKSGEIYYFAAIGGYDIGGSTEFIITESGNFIVPRTGRYMLELYGGGGGASNYGRMNEGSSIQGGSSCQRYDSISLTAGDSIDITIGVGGASMFSGTSTATGTSFGTYRVDGGGAADGRTATGGSGSGNLGTSGRVVGYSNADYNNNNGTFGSMYGRGGYGGRSSSLSYGENGTDGAVYLKYLGA